MRVNTKEMKKEIVRLNKEVRELKKIIISMGIVVTQGVECTNLKKLINEMIGYEVV